MNARTLLRLLACSALVTTTTAAGVAAPGATDDMPLPHSLRDTGLYAEGSATVVRAGNLAFSPQYPLYSDGATKRRWINLPPGTAIDGSQSDEWVFPPGTRLWKEFSYGRRVETRFIERLGDGSWRYATYVWNADGTDATLAEAEGVAALRVDDAPGGHHTIPSRTDCLACHEGTAVPVLGFSALQLSPDRDPRAPHAEPARADEVELRQLATRGLVRGLPPALLEEPPRIAAKTPTGRAALGYLHGNCGHCHNEVGPLADLDLVLAQRAATQGGRSERTVESLAGRASRYRPPNAGSAQRVVPGRPDESVLTLRMRSPNPFARMPPLGVERIDGEGIALIQQWIRNDLNHAQEASP